MVSPSACRCAEKKKHESGETVEPVVFSPQGKAVDFIPKSPNLMVGRLAPSGDDYIRNIEELRKELIKKNPSAVHICKILSVSTYKSPLEVHSLHAN